MQFQTQFSVRRVLPFVALALPLLTLVGCGDGNPPRVTVAGTVLVDGEPLTKGSVMFVPEGGRPSHAKIGPDGRFELSCFDKDDGALLGTHRVAVSAKKIITLNNVEWYAPARYSDYKTSGLTVEVTGPVDDLVLELFSKEGDSKGRKAGKAS